MASVYSNRSLLQFFGPSYTTARNSLSRSPFCFPFLPTMADNADWRARPTGDAPKLGGTRWSSGGSGVGQRSGGKTSSKRGGKKRYDP